MGEPKVNPFKYDLVSRSVTARDLERYLRAVHTAFDGEHDRVRVGAVMSQRKFLVYAANTMRNPVGNVAYGEATVHAEAGAIARMPWNQRRGATIYVARLSLDDSPVPSFPCDACMATIKQAGVRHLVYFDGNSVVKVRVQ